MKIPEVSERYGISSDTLRYYERIRLIPPVNRNESGIRDYGEIDIKRVEFIKLRLLKSGTLQTTVHHGASEIPPGRPACCLTLEQICCCEPLLCFLLHIPGIIR